ncbi:GNAT family N-acetyltransferase [Streptomyces sp. NBC_00988]|uniref:GNAT family N-acetyltransferase n=1 Tax=Streptomyces sp. NBC_00988 TaxID=2903704 RepID=UPI003867B198|nr:GNAT family N-acetyltransferase [Streptomyces sp. NBC_00988]
MRPDDWHLTDDVDEFLAQAGEFLRSRPTPHTQTLTVIEKIRERGSKAHGTEAPVFGRLERGGEVQAAFYRVNSRRNLNPTSLSPEQADTLAAHLTGLGHSLPGVLSDHDTATTFAEAWQRHTGATSVRSWGARLHRLGTLTPPEPVPEGRGRVAGEQDRDQVVRWCREFCVDVGETVSIDAIDAGDWATSRFGDRHFTFWETPDGIPASMAAVTSMTADMVRIDPVYTPAHLRARGYAGAVTVEVSRAALAAGATDVVLFADPANTTSTALYQRIGFVPVGDFVGYDFLGAARE